MESGSDSSDEEYSQFKVVVLGNGAVGKTSLIRHFCESGFDKSYKQTIGLDFYSRKVPMPAGHPTVLLQLWDIGGQQIGGKMLANYIHGAHAVCLVYDITNASSFKDVADWKQAVEDVFRDTPAVSVPKMILVGNKHDLPNRQVPVAAHEAFALENHVQQCFVSARSGEHVNAMFTKMAATLAGVTIEQRDLDLTNRVTANVVSKPEERQEAPRVPVLHATTVTAAKKKSSDDCAVM